MIDYYPPSSVYTLSYREEAKVIVKNVVPEPAWLAKGNKQTNIKDMQAGEDTKEDQEEDKEDRTQMDEDTAEEADDDYSDSEYIY